jgi:pyridoxine kinase
MSLALILSSSVAASRIGGSAQSFVFAAFQIDPVLVPTVQFGTSPAKAGRGRATEAEHFREMLEDIEAVGLFPLFDIVLTGHFSSAAQVELAAAAIDRVRAASEHPSGPVVVVDPILGDHPKGLYVKPEVADALEALLLPRADWITPNVWELERLTGLSASTPQAAAHAARQLEPPALVTSVPAGEGGVGLLLVEEDAATLFVHPLRQGVPNGTGDLVTAVFAAGLIGDAGPRAAAERAARAAVEAVEAAVAWNAPELPLVVLGQRLVRPGAQVRIEAV